MTQDQTYKMLLKELGPTVVCSKARAILGGIGNTKFYELIADGAFQSFKVGTIRLVDTPSLLAYLDKLKHEAQPRHPRVDAMLQGRAARRAERQAERPKFGREGR